jgi:uncharacterized delta-60 repeat protein
MSIFLFMKILLKKLLQFKFLLNVKHFSTTLVITIVLTNLQIPAWAADGDLDTSFSGDGIVSTLVGSDGGESFDAAIQSDGKIVVAGYSWNDSDSRSDFAVARFNSNGTLDTTFGTGGQVITNLGLSSEIRSIALQSDGKIVAAGFLSNGANDDFAIVRYNSNGSLDTTFSGDGKLSTDLGSYDSIYSIALQSDGKIVATGVSNDNFAIARYDTNGTLDTTFSGDGKLTTDMGSSDGIQSIALQSDGKIVAAGYSGNDFAIARYDTNGTLDASFDTDGKVTTNLGSIESINSIAIQSDGKIVAAGYSGSDFAIARYDTNGTLDASFDTAGIVITDIASSDDGFNSVLLQSDGKIVAAGYTDNAGFSYLMAVARYNTDGSLDSTFNGDGIALTAVRSSDDSATAVAIQTDGNIVIAGYSDSGLVYEFAVVRHLGSSSGGGGSGGGGSGGDNPVALDFPWVGDQSISCPEANPWINEKLDFAKNVKPVLVNAENSVGRTITPDSFESLKSSGVLFDTDSKKVNTATETLPDFGCKDRLLSGKVNQPIQFIAGGYTLQSDAHGYINTADLIWHDLNEVTLTTNTAAFMHTIKFTKPGKYMVVLTEQPDTSAGISPTYGARSIRFVININ